MSDRSSSSQNLPHIRDILGAELSSSTSGRREHRSTTVRSPLSDPRYQGGIAYRQQPIVQDPPLTDASVLLATTSTHRHPSSSNYTQPQTTHGPGGSRYPGGPGSYQVSPSPTLHPASWGNPSHTMGTSDPSRSHSSSQRLHQHPSLGPHSEYGRVAQPAVQYTSPQGVLVEGMRGPGLTPLDASQYHTTSFPVIPEDQQTNARYVCATCNKRFSRPSSLRTHELSHSGVKPFACTYPNCGRRFSVQSNMRRHVTKVHERGGSSKQGESSEDEYDDESETCARH